MCAINNSEKGVSLPKDLRPEMSFLIFIEYNPIIQTLRQITQKSPSYIFDFTASRCAKN